MYCTIKLKILKKNHVIFHLYKKIKYNTFNLKKSYIALLKWRKNIIVLKYSGNNNSCLKYYNGVFIKLGTCFD